MNGSRPFCIEIGDIKYTNKKALTPFNPLCWDGNDNQIFNRALPYQASYPGIGAAETVYSEFLYSRRYIGLQYYLLLKKVLSLLEF